jgi:hypothetical protein
MSFEPPGSGDAHDQESAAESSGNNADNPSGDGGRATWKSSILTLVGVLAVAGGIGMFLFLTHGSNSKPEQVTPARGLACPYLQQASDAYDRGDRVTYNRAVKQAAKVAEETLQKSGEVFGTPERLALDIELGRVDDPQHLLSRALAVCAQSNNSSVA